MGARPKAPQSCGRDAPSGRLYVGEVRRNATNAHPVSTTAAGIMVSPEAVFPRLEMAQVPGGHSAGEAGED